LESPSNDTHLHSAPGSFFYCAQHRALSQLRQLSCDIKRTLSQANQIESSSPDALVAQATAQALRDEVVETWLDLALALDKGAPIAESPST